MEIYIAYDALDDVGTDVKHRGPIQIIRSQLLRHIKVDLIELCWVLALVPRVILSTVPAPLLAAASIKKKIGWPSDYHIKSA